jgi:hypothetical protein
MVAAPWLEKMTPANRFVIRGEHSSNPKSRSWSGNLPQTDLPVAPF